MSIAAEAPIPSRSRTIAGYYALAGLYTLSAAAIWGVNTLFLLDAGLSFFEVFVANAAFSLGTVLFEIPTGVVAGLARRRPRRDRLPRHPRPGIRARLTGDERGDARGHGRGWIPGAD
ncbi:hypothetical protein BH20ACT13_BH20ACT13_15020 [soil metagenome]